MRQDADDRSIVLYPSKKLLFKAAWPSLAGVLLALPLIIVWRSKKRRRYILSPLLGTTLLLWESLHLHAWYRLLFPRPDLVINEQGIVYTPALPWFVNMSLKIRWEEISAMHIGYWTAQGKMPRSGVSRFLFIIPKDIEEFSQQLLRLNVLEGLAQQTLPRRLQALLIGRLLPLLMVTWFGGALLLPLLPISLDELLAQIGSRFQEEIQQHGIEIREEQKIEFRPGLTVTLDREDFRRWLEQQEAIVGFGRSTSKKRPLHDDTPLARYLAHTLDQPVYIVQDVVFSLSSSMPLGRLPQWAGAFDKRVQSQPGKSVMKQEALDALDAR